MKITSSRSLVLGRLLALAVLVIVSACGGDDDECIETAKTICAAACTCGGSDGCAIGDSTGALTFDDEADCVTLYSLGCSQDDGSIDFAACQSALATPPCVQSTDGRALDLPATCEAPERRSTQPE
jgi:hypothetical protein